MGREQASSWAALAPGWKNRGVGRLATRAAANILDAGGRIVAPGHVTQYAHYDATLFRSPHCIDFGENGVATIVNADCGFSAAPVRQADRVYVRSFRLAADMGGQRRRNASRPADEFRQVLLLSALVA